MKNQKRVGYDADKALAKAGKYLPRNRSFLIHNQMKKILYTLVILTAIAAASCNSEQRTESSADSVLTDTALMDSSTVDSLDVVDSLGLGTTPGTRPNQ